MTGSTLLTALYVASIGGKFSRLALVAISGVDNPFCRRIRSFRAGGASCDSGSAIFRCQIWFAIRSRTARSTHKFIDKFSLLTFVALAFAVNTGPTVRARGANLIQHVLADIALATQRSTGLGSTRFPARRALNGFRRVGEPVKRKSQESHTKKE